MSDYLIGVLSTIAVLLLVLSVAAMVLAHKQRCPETVTGSRITADGLSQSFTVRCSLQHRGHVLHIHKGFRRTAVWDAQHTTWMDNA